MLLKANLTINAKGLRLAKSHEGYHNVFGGGAGRYNGLRAWNLAMDTSDLFLVRRRKR